MKKIDSSCVKCSDLKYYIDLYNKFVVSVFDEKQKQLFDEEFKKLNESYPADFLSKRPELIQHYDGAFKKKYIALQRKFNLIPPPLSYETMTTFDYGVYFNYFDFDYNGFYQSYDRVCDDEILEEILNIYPKNSTEQKKLKEIYSLIVDNGFEAISRYD